MNHAPDDSPLEPIADDEAPQEGLSSFHSNPQRRASQGSRVAGVTGPTGEPGLPPSRPSSMATTQSGSGRRWSQAPPSSRRGGLLQHHIGGSSSVAGSAGSRPTTSASRTHVPLAAQGFFRPMSSQRLQQQRNQRPNSLLGHNHTFSDHSPDFSPGNPYRQSAGSNRTAKNSLPAGLHYDADHPPPSRGTDVTDRDFMPDRTTANTSPTGAETVQSRGESITPLQRPRPPHLDLSSANNDPRRLPTPGKSPRSFSSNFILQNREGTRMSRRNSLMRPSEAHEKLASTESSPRMQRKEQTKQLVRRELGKNYEYWTGNTVFCLGGRLQNTRDLPVNVATGTFIILPAALFFAFSYVSLLLLDGQR